MPPLNLDDMRTSWTRLRDNAHNLPNPDRLARIYRDLQAVANQEGRSIYVTSSLIALGALRTGIRMGNTHIFEYYRDALNDIGSDGLEGYVKRVTAPYRLTVVHHLSPRNKTYTERYLLGRRGEEDRHADDS